MLGLKEGSIPTESCIVKSSDTDKCDTCGRTITWKDVIVSALKVHSSEFLAAALSGKFGYIVREQPPENMCCSACGNKVNGDKYCGVTYYCVRY